MSEHVAQAEPALELPKAKPLGEQAAAGRIQRFWRWCRYVSTTWLLTWRFERIKLKLTNETTKFEQLITLLRDTHVIQTIRQYIRCIIRTSEHMHIPYEIRSDEKFKIKFNHRKIIAAFMIGNWPTHIFESMGQTEEDLLTASRALLSSMDIISNHIQVTEGFYEQPQDLSMPFHQMVGQYLTCFEKWAIPDNKKLTTRIVAALIALYAELERLSKDEPDYSRVKTELQDQIKRLRNKLAEYSRQGGEESSGDAILAKFDASRATGTVAADFGVETGTMKSPLTAILKPLSEELIASELMLDPHYELIPDSNVHCLHKDLHNAMWDSLLMGLEQNPPDYSIVLKVVEDIRDGLMMLNPEDQSIIEIIDSAHIEQQLANNASRWDWSSCKHITCQWSVFNIIIRLNPERTKETLTLWNDDVGNALRMAEPQDQPRALKNALKFLTERVNRALIDVANKNIRKISPVILENGIQYLKAKFNQRLEEGKMTLENTTKWIVEAIRRANVNGTVTPNDLRSVNHEMVVDVHFTGMVRLFFDHSTPIPETFNMIRHHVVNMRHKLETISQACNVAILVFSEINNKGNSEAEKTQGREIMSHFYRFLDHDIENNGNIFEHAVLELLDQLDGFSALDDQSKSLIRIQIQSLDDRENLQNKTMVSCIILSCKDPTYVHDCPSLTPFLPHIDQITKDFKRRLADLNLSVHYDLYKELISEAVAALGGEAAEMTHRT